MGLVNNIKKEYKNKPNHFLPLKFKKFQMNVDSSGIRILISANFLAKGNHTVTAQDGILYLKINQSQSNLGAHKTSVPLGSDEKSIDLKIKLPSKRYRVLNSVLFKNDMLKIHLTERSKADHELAFMRPSLMSNKIPALSSR